MVVRRFVSCVVISRAGGAQRRDRYVRAAVSSAALAKPFAYGHIAHSMRDEPESTAARVAVKSLGTLIRRNETAAFPNQPHLQARNALGGPIVVARTASGGCSSARLYLVDHQAQATQPDDTHHATR